MISTQLYIYKCRYGWIEIHRRLLCSGTSGLLISHCSSLTRGEKNNSYKSFVSYNANNTLNVRHILWCFRSQFIFAGQDPKNLTAAATVENSTQWQRTQFSAFMAETQLSACMVKSQILNYLVGPQLLNIMVGPHLTWFLKSTNFQPISSGHDVIQTPTLFSLWGLLCQWWLSYPLCTSVNCTNWLPTWTLYPNISKPNQTE